jgi:hypothetical protein
MTQENYTNLDHRSSQPPLKASSSLTDQDRRELVELWDAIPRRGIGRASRSSPEGKRLGRRLVSHLASGVSSYELAAALSVSTSTALLIAGQSRKQTTSRPRTKIEPTESAVPVARPCLEPRSSLAVPELTETELLEIIDRDLAMLQARLPSFKVELIIERRQIADE